MKPRNYLLLLIVLTVISMIVIANAQAADLPADVKVCKPADVRFASDSTPHQNMCWQTARVLTQLVRDSGWPCESVVGSLLSPARKTYFVTCIFHDFNRQADRNVLYLNYSSTNGEPFAPTRER